MGFDRRGVWKAHESTNPAFIGGTGDSALTSLIAEAYPRMPT